MAISQFPAASWESYRRNRNCLPEIATAPLGPRNDNSGDCFRFNAALFGSAVQRRARLSLPLQRPVDALCSFPISAPSPSKSSRPCPLILHIVPPIRHPAAGHRNSCKSAKKRKNFTQIFVDKNRIW